MSNVWVIGDGTPAYEIAKLAQNAGHLVFTSFVDEKGNPDELIYEQPRWGFAPFTRRPETNPDVIIEAIIKKSQKLTAWRGYAVELQKKLTDTSMLVSTLSASATEISAWVARTKMVPRQNIIGWATLPPMEHSSAIELLPTQFSNERVLNLAKEFFTSLGKEPVIIKDCVGGVLPRVVASLINNAAYALMEGVASAADIDAAMKLGTNYPYGPLEWADKIGLDQVLGILEALCETYGEDRYRPAPILRQLVYAGHWGERTGCGFYEYP